MHRLTPGTGFYCDEKSGNHVIGVMQHKANLLTVQVSADQSEYVSVSLRKMGGTAMRDGAITSDQPFAIRLLEPEYGASRIKEYQMLSGACPVP